MACPGRTDVRSAEQDWPSLDDVRNAAARIAGEAVHTPVLRATGIDTATGASVLLKAEHLQRTGSFKWRGALNRLASLSGEQRRCGVVAASSGNHALAVATGARVLGIPAAVVIPRDIPALKLRAIRAQGARVVRYDRRTQDRSAIVADLSREQGLTPVPSSDDKLVVAGQATVALELSADPGDIDLLVVPVGGGGLAAGCAVVSAWPGGPAVIGVEPASADDTRRSMQAGSRCEIPPPVTIADGLTHRTPGPYTFAILRSLLEAVVVVEEDEIVAAMRLLHDELGILAEPSGACALAALLAGRIDRPGPRVAVVVSGGNIDGERFRALLAAGPRGW